MDLFYYENPFYIEDETNETIIEMNREESENHINELKKTENEREKLTKQLNYGKSNRPAIN